MSGAAVRQVIAIHGSDHRMSQVQVLDCFRNVPRLFAVERARFSFSDRAKAAVPRADIATQHESRRSIGPAFEDVRTTRFLADRMKIQALDQLQHLILVSRIAQTNLEPGGFGLAWLRGVADYL
jgi:hypothetical protein